MRILLAVSLLVPAVFAGRAATVYEQPHDSSGTLFQSSSSMNDYDRFVFDSFSIASGATITEVHWRGGYMIPPVYPSTPVADFSVTFLASNGSQPDIVEPPIASYEWYTGIGNAGETPAGSFDGVAMYDYSYLLPTPFVAVAGQTYWIEIAALQGGVPGWGIAAGSGGDNQHWGSFINGPGGTNYLQYTGDSAFALIAAGPDKYTLADALAALRVWAGIYVPTSAEFARLNVETTTPSGNTVDCLDALRITRKATGLDANP